MIKDRLTAYALDFYGSKPDYPWENMPNHFVLRHADTGKWYALFMTVPRKSLGIDSREPIDILNLKCEPLMLGSLLMKKGFFKAYHMNKNNWITVSLEGEVPYEEIVSLMKISYELTSKKR